MAPVLPTLRYHLAVEAYGEPQSGPVCDEASPSTETETSAAFSTIGEDLNLTQAAEIRRQDSSFFTVWLSSLSIVAIVALAVVTGVGEQEEPLAGITGYHATGT